MPLVLESEPRKIIKNHADTGPGTRPRGWYGPNAKDKTAFAAATRRCCCPASQQVTRAELSPRVLETTGPEMPKEPAWLADRAPHAPPHVTTSLIHICLLAYRQTVQSH